MAPRFSIVTPVADPPAAVLAAAIESVRQQTFGGWELCLVTDGCDATTRAIVDAAAASDPRIKVSHRMERGGIVAATNDALSLATGELVAFLDHDDELHLRALEAVDAVTDDDVDYVYTDEDKITLDGRHFDQFLKPDWSPERLRCQMYTCHLGVLRRSLITAVGGLRPGYDGSQDWDLVLRATEQARRIVHVPEILYHWRVTAGSAAGDPLAKSYAIDAARRAVTDHLERTGLAGTVSDVPGYPGILRIDPALREHPLVSIVVPTRGTVREIHGDAVPLVVRCVRSVVERTDYPDIEIVCVADTETPRAVVEELRSLGRDRVRIIAYDRPFNFADKINVGVLHARGDYLLFLNDDTEVEAADWLSTMVMYAQQERVGAVGAKLLLADRRLQHVGVRCIPADGPGHHYTGFREGWPGYFGNVLAAGNFLAVTGACLLTRRDCFEEVGGLSSAFPVNFNDVDYCFKLHHRGYRTVYAPNAVLFHYESATREAVVLAPEIALLRSRWQSLLDDDPYYHRGFTRVGESFLVPPYRADGTLLLAPAS